MRLFLILIVCLCFSAQAFATESHLQECGNVPDKKDRVVNLFVWSGYVPQKIVDTFQKDCDMKVTVTEFDSNEELYAKLKALGSSQSYDLITPSSYYVQLLKKGGLLDTLDKSKLPNLTNINLDLMNKQFDPGNQVTLPYLWGITGIALNKDPQYWPDGKVPDIKNWSDFWKPEFKNKLLMIDDPKDVFTIALFKDGHGPNDKNPADIKQAYEELRALMPNIRTFNSDAVISMYGDDDLTVGMVWIGDLYQAMKGNSNLDFIYPQDGYVIWIDTMALMKNSPHKAAAYAFMNYLYSPEVAAKVSASRGYASPEPAATKLLPEALQQNHVLNPPLDRLKGPNVHFQNYLGEDTNKIYQCYWTLLKLGAGSTDNDLGYLLKKIFGSSAEEDPCEPTTLPPMLTPIVNEQPKRADEHLNHLKSVSKKPARKTVTGP